MVGLHMFLGGLVSFWVVWVVFGWFGWIRILETTNTVVFLKIQTSPVLFRVYNKAIQFLPFRNYILLIVHIVGAVHYQWTRTSYLGDHFCSGITFETANGATSILNEFHSRTWSVSWSGSTKVHSLAEFRHNRIVQPPHENHFNVCWQYKEK